MSLASDIENFGKQTEQEISQIVRGACFELFSRIVSRTPVDTGRARGNWQISLDQDALVSPGFAGGQKSRGDEAVQESNKAAATQAALDAGLAALGKFNSDTAMVTIYNNLDYIVPLEYGHSQKQAPNGMVRLSCQEFPAIVAKFSQGL